MIKLESILKGFEENLAKQDKSKQTIKNYISGVEKFAKYMEEKIGKFSPSDIIELDIKEYRSYLLNVKKEKPSTINLNLSALTNFCDYLVSIEMLKTNPVRSIDKIRIQKERVAPEVFENKNILYRLRREIYSSNNLRDIAIYEILYNTGVRVSELCNIELDDVEISERKGTLTIREGKGSKYREIPLNSTVRKAISNYLTIRLNIPTKDKKLLQGERGPLKRQAINKILNKYAKRAGITERVHPHKLRHQLGHDLAENGESVTKIAEILGHSDINVTRRYTMPTREEKAEALERLNGF